MEVEVVREDGVADDVGNQTKHGRRHDDRADRQTIEPVGQVDRVGRADHHKNSEGHEAHEGLEDEAPDHEEEGRREEGRPQGLAPQRRLRPAVWITAPRVVATQWAIDDRATSEVMKRFYEGMLVRGERPAAALRAAQIAIWKSKGWEAPYYWGAFTLQGEWR